MLVSTGRSFMAPGFLFLILFLLAACGPGKLKKDGPVFYPEPPELPRVQFLTSFTWASDVQPEKSRFEVFITGEQEARRRPDKPYGVAMHEGRIYVCDTNSTVLVFDLGKKTYGPLEGAVGTGKLLQPLNISIDTSGNKYVADPGRSSVQVYDRNDLFVRALESPGGWKPVDAAPFGDSIYVVDTKSAEIHVFDREKGNYLRKFGQTSTAEGSLRIPVNIAFDNDGYLYVSDAGRFQIVKMDRDGNVRGTIGRLGVNTGHFARPRGLALDRQGRLYVVDAAFDNVQIFTNEGRLLMSFGKAGVKPGDLFLPAAVHIDYDNISFFRHYADPRFEIEHLIFVISQFGDRLVNVYGFGRETGKTYPSDEELLQRLLEKMKKKAADQKDQPPAGKESQ